MNQYFEVLAWGYKQRAGSSGPKAVLQYLVTRANDWWICIPSQRLIAEETEMTERSVRRHLCVLEDKGLIHRIRRRRPDGSWRSEAFVLCGIDLCILVKNIESRTDIPDFVVDLLPNLKALIVEHQPADNLSGGVKDEVEPADNVSSGQSDLRTKTTEPADTESDHEHQPNPKTYPLSPPTGGDPVHDRILAFKPGPALVDDLARQLKLDRDFIHWLVPVWRQVAIEGGSRIKSAATSFQRWVNRHKGLEGLRREWWQQSHGTSVKQPHAVAVTAENVFKTAAGQQALIAGVGGAFLNACDRDGRILEAIHLLGVIADQSAADSKPKDEVAQRCSDIAAQREHNLRAKYLEPEAVA